MNRQILQGVLLIVGLLHGHFAIAETRNPIQRHMQHMLNGGDQWRTENPYHKPESGSPAEFGLRFNLSPDGSHIVGNLTGIFDEGKEALYWSLLAFYNPVTEKVITQQVGWDGTLLYGEVPLQTGMRQVIDMISYGANGKMSISRHENIFEGSEKHSSVVFEPDDSGAWVEKQRWVWVRHAAPEFKPRVPSKPSEDALSPLKDYVGFLLEGSGRWQAPNPAYDPALGNEKFYNMNYRWGRHRQHVIGEIVSIFADGQSRKEWSLYITYNPVTDMAYLEQTGSKGVYFRGELGETSEGRHSQQGLIYFPDGTVKSVRDEVEVIDDRAYVSHVYERAENGGWKKVREWTWKRQD